MFCGRLWSVQTVQTVVEILVWDVLRSASLFQGHSRSFLPAYQTFGVVSIWFYLLERICKVPAHDIRLLRPKVIVDHKFSRDLKVLDQQR